VMVLVKATKDSEAGLMPSTELLEAMGKYNEELVKAGIMLAGEGLKPSSQGKRVAFDGPSRAVIDGPFAETRELVAGFWLWQVKDMAEAVEWVKRCPNPMPGPSQIEIRPLYEAADFGEALTPELAVQEDREAELCSNAVCQLERCRTRGIHVTRPHRHDGHDVGRADPRVGAHVPAQVDAVARAGDSTQERLHERLRLADERTGERGTGPLPSRQRADQLVGRLGQADLPDGSHGLVPW